MTVVRSETDRPVVTPLPVPDGRGGPVPRRRQRRDVRIVITYYEFLSYRADNNPTADGYGVITR